MATYSALFGIRSNSDLRNKVAVAVTVKAQELIDGTNPTVNEITWASNAIANPISQADKILNYVLAANKSASVTNIINATDSVITA